MAQTSRQQGSAVSGLGHSGRHHVSAFAIGDGHGVAVRVVRQGSAAQRRRSSVASRRLFGVHKSAIAGGPGEAVHAATATVAKQ